MKFLLYILSSFISPGEEITKDEILRRIGALPANIKAAVREIVFNDVRKDGEDIVAGRGAGSHGG